MTTIDQKVSIPENRLLRLDLHLPPDIPSGEAVVRVIILPGALESSERKAFEGLAGSLRDSEIFSRDGAEFQREVRDEW